MRKIGVYMIVLFENCIIYKIKYFFDDCRGFCFKLLEERKRFLKLNNLCFKCCVFNIYKSCDCSVSILCKECGSKYYIIVFYINRNDYVVIVDDNII